MTAAKALCCLASCILVSCIDGFVAQNQKTRSVQPSRGLSSASADADPTTTLEVCLSPGCLADGAQDTLQKLQALIPQDGNVEVKRGVCCSLCGNGPVVLNGNQKIRKVSSSDKILKILEEMDDGVVPSLQSEKILESFDLIQEARAAAKSRDFGKATDLFQQVLDIGSDQLAEGYSIRQVEYLVQSSQEQMRSFAQMPGKESKEKAIAAAQRGVDLINAAVDKDLDEDEAILLRYSSLECLQEATEAFCKSVPKPPQDLLKEELTTLQALLEMTPSNLSTQQKNKQRSLGFRLQKLEKEVKG